ncbi:RrF2 family transcriptional regulator [Marinibaculum pumilum]|uniref:RrF2 family transcriptional regulator n=1 Tax=Marinibaculum pumilum TaxID=1766165 RepID=A0ABV7KV55_9PROT
MALYGANVEYGLHCLLLLVRMPGGAGADGATLPPSAGDLAAYQGVSPSYLAKTFTRLEKAGLVRATEGAGGGFELARPAAEISVLDVVDALEGGRKLFDCQDVRHRCILYADAPPAWATSGTCGIHAVMLQAERQMRQVLGATSLADLAAGLAPKVPAEFERQARAWFAERAARRGNRRAGRAGKDAG